MSLIEVSVVMAVIGVLAALTVGNFRRAFEQSRADVASANLQAIWSAQRIYWLENRAFAEKLTELQSLGLLDPAVGSATNPFSYSITKANKDTFTATAKRAGSKLWKGSFVIDETGALSGTIAAAGEAAITPGFK